MVRVLPLAVLLILCTAVVAPAQVVREGSIKPATLKSYEDLLLDAELAELAAGDLTAAMKEYQSLQANENASASVRARSLLYLARCHRKRGELEKSRNYLEQLVERYPDQTPVLRRARTLLRELQRGKPDNPDFDWLAEFQKNPEIQARIFDLAMELVSPSSEAGERAASQLLALGATSIPVLEQLLGNSRDPRQRTHLAMLLVLLGQHEHLPLVLDTGSEGDTVLVRRLSHFVGGLSRLPPETRQSLIDLCNSMDDSTTSPKLRGAVRLRAGDFTHMDSDLRGFRSAGLRKMYGSGLLTVVLAAPGGKQAVSRLISEPDARWNKKAFHHLIEDLHRQDPALAARHLANAEHQLGDTTYVLEWLVATLEDSNDWATLTRLGHQKDLRACISSHYRRRYVWAHKGQDPKPAPASWAPVLSAMDEYDELARLATRHSEVIPELRRLIEEDKYFPTVGNVEFTPEILDLMAEYLHTRRGSELAHVLHAMTIDTETQRQVLLQCLTRTLRGGDDVDLSDNLRILWAKLNQDEQLMSAAATRFEKTIADPEAFLNSRHYAVGYLERAGQRERLPAILPLDVAVERDDPLLRTLINRSNKEVDLMNRVYGVPEMPPERRQQLLDGMLGSKQHVVRQWAMRNYRLRGTDPNVLLLNALDNEDTRSYAVDRACKQTSSDILPVLVKILELPKRSHPFMAIESLGNVGSIEAIEPLSALLEEDDYRIRDAAITALKRVRNAMQETEEWKQLVEVMRLQREAAGQSGDE